VAVNNLTFKVPAGGVVGFVVPNGSGKSTTIRVFLVLIKPSAGSGTVLGETIQHPESFARPGRRADRGPRVCRFVVGPGQSAESGRMRRLPAKRVDEVLKIVGLAGREDDKASTHSLGMKQRLGIAAALLPDPELLVLDSR
jgi:ABC-2 type transport system ATP-binding protein